MKKQLTFLGIETSCDETAASVVRENDNGSGEILSNVVSSQIDEHKEFGGVVPEIAARAHVEKIDFIINKSLKESKTNINDIDGIAVTAGPGLIVCLTVGLSVAKTIASKFSFSNLLILVSIFPLIRFIFKSFLKTFNCAALRKELVPMIESGFKSIIDLYFELIKTSRGSFLFKKILVSKPLVSSDGKSFKA